MFRIEPPLAVTPCIPATVLPPAIIPPSGVVKNPAGTPVASPAAMSLDTLPKVSPKNPPDSIGYFLLSSGDFFHF